MKRSDVAGYGTVGATVALVVLGFMTAPLLAHSPFELAAALLALTLLAGLVMLAGFWLAGRLHDGD